MALGPETLGCLVFKFCFLSLVFFRVSGHLVHGVWNFEVPGVFGVWRLILDVFVFKLSGISGSGSWDFLAFSV